MIRDPMSIWQYAAPVARRAGSTVGRLGARGPEGEWGMASCARSGGSASLKRARFGGGNRVSERCCQCLPETGTWTAWRDMVGEQPCIALSCDGMACTAQCLYSLFGAPGRSRSLRVAPGRSESLRAGHKKGPGLLHLGIELPHPGASETARIHDSAHARFHMNKRNPVVGWPLGRLATWPLGHLAVWLCQFNTYAQCLSHRC